jgi:hypothetical protein
LNYPAKLPGGRKFHRAHSAVRELDQDSDLSRAFKVFEPGNGNDLARGPIGVGSGDDLVTDAKRARGCHSKFWHVGQR